MKKYLPLVIVLILIVGVASFFFLKRKQTAVPTTDTQATFSPAYVQLSPTPTPESTVAPVSSNTNPSVPPNSTEVRGQIVCDFQIPPAPNEQGSAAIKSNWNNTSVDVCVTAAGTQTLLASDTNLNSSRIDSINWISSNVEYVFTLYGKHPGDPSCSGTVLSSCQIGTQGTPAPQTSGHR